jgi:hypothetical protein
MSMRSVIFTSLAVWLGFLALYYYEAEFRQFVRGFCRALACGIEVAADASRKLLGKVFGWLKQEKVARPCLVLVGFVALPLAIWCARADYLILVDTLGVLLPWTLAAICMAVILVGLVALCGFLAHSDGRGRQVIAVALLIGLLWVHVNVAKKREIALQKMAWEERRALDPSCPPFQIDRQSLVLAETVAVVAPGGESAGAWAALEFGGAALLYVLMGGALSPVALIAALTYLLRRWLVEGDRLVKGGDRMFDALMSIPKAVATIFKADGTLLNGLAKWSAAVLNHVYNLRHEQQTLKVRFKDRLRDDGTHQGEEELEQVHQRQLAEQQRAHEKQEFIKDLQAASALAQRQREAIADMNEQKK